MEWTNASREQQEEAVESYKWHLLNEYRHDFDKETLDELWEEEGYDSWEAEGWTQSETECWAWGDFDIERID